MPTLHDGREVPSDSEEWRHECEARKVMTLPSVDARRDWIESVEKKRGKPAADRLRETVRALWAQRDRGR